MATQEEIKEGADTLMERIDEFVSNLTDVTPEATNKQTEFHNQFNMLKPSMEEFNLGDEIINLTDSLEKMDAEIQRISSNNSVRTPPRQQGGRKTKKAKKSKKLKKSRKTRKARK
jgi:hypothetical protein